MGPSISVVIAARNAAGTLGAALTSVVPQLEPDDEVVVVDDGSTDATSAVARAAGVRVVRLDGHRGLGAAYLAGEREARGTVIAYLHAEDEAAPGYVAALRSAFAGGAVAAAGTLLPDTRPGRVIRHGVRTSGGHDLEGRNGFLPSWAGAAAAVRADILADVGGSDPCLRLASDADLAFRLGFASVTIDAVPEAAVVYRQRASLGSYLRSRYHRGVGEAHLAWKWQEYTFADVRARAGRRRPVREVGRAMALLLGGDHEAAVESLLDAATVTALRAGRAAGWLDIAVTGRTRPPAPVPARLGRQLVATSMAGPPPFVISAPNRRVALGLAASLRCHPQLAAPPPGLAQAIGERWQEPAPWSRRLVRWANAAGWRLHEDLAARRLEDAGPETLADAYVALHGVSAWLTGKPRWVIVEAHEAATRAAAALGRDVRGAVLGDAPAIATELGGSYAPQVAAAVPLAGVAAALSSIRPAPAGRL